jgi:hypothetical protein
MLNFKKIVISALVLMLFINTAYALQELAGPIVITTPIGGSNSSLNFGLINEDNETIDVILKASEEIEKYITFIPIITLEPNKLTYVNLTASLPRDYTGDNITGNMYALQEGKPGQVQINIQLMKRVTIVPYKLNEEQPFIYFMLIFIIAIVLFAVAFVIYRAKNKNGGKINEKSNDSSNTAIVGYVSK